jgi:hypothetical protein
MGSRTWRDSRRTLFRLSILAAYFGVAPAKAPADDVFYHVPLIELRVIEGVLPDAGGAAWNVWQRARAAHFVPTATIDGAGEIYVRSTENWLSPKDVDAAVAIRTTERRDVTGWLCLPKNDLSGMARVRFSVPAELGSVAGDARQRFYETAETHYRRLLERDVPGAAWFRSRLRSARMAQGKEPDQAGDAGRNRFGLRETFDLFTGGRAISENLQLDRNLTLLPESSGELVSVESLKGITVAAMDWQALLKKNSPKEPALDPLAARVPHDQYAFFFPSYDDLIRAMDEFDEFGVEVLRYLEPQAEDARIGKWYRQQMCIEVTPLDRLLGNQLVLSAAMTGSDPYLHTGTDCAVLFETKNPGALLEYLRTKQTAAKREYENVKEERGKHGGGEYFSVRSPQRRICSYLFTVGNVVGVTNSTVQLRRLIETAQGKHSALTSLDEYKFFRQRYQRGQETGFLLLSDAAIRRLCSPQWRIGSSRRMRAAAILAELQAESLEEMAKGQIDAAGLEHPRRAGGLGRITIYPQGVRSAVYGESEFLTPIAELPLDKVTKAEADGYNSWRTAYEASWRGYFDPIAIQFSIKPERVAADVTVIPLIGGSGYRELVQIAGAQDISEDGGDRHAGAIGHAALALDGKSELMKQAGEFLSTFVGVKDALSWLGRAVSIYIDDDPVWKEFVKASDPQKFWEERNFAIPVAVYVDSTDQAKLVRVLEGLRNQLVALLGRKGLREKRTHNGVQYMALRENFLGSGGKETLCYVAGPSGLVFSLNESTLKKAIDRQVERSRGKAEDGKAPPPRLGKHLTVYATAQAVDVWQEAIEKNYHTDPQLRSWSNLHILNEWKRRFPEQDPVALHEKYWHVSLACPGGGKYVWNPRWQTMESTAFGHPGEPKRDRRTHSRLEDVRSLNFGVTFENQGLRAKAIIERQKK